jgi:hypothetical protein
MLTLALHHFTKSNYLTLQFRSIVEVVIWKDLFVLGSQVVKITLVISSSILLYRKGTLEVIDPIFVFSVI